ncbi:MAG: tRNA uracil 4-sulfurtransferase ThiI, partial [Oscillospiraceae bacterium]
DNIDLDEAITRLSKVYGIAALTRCAVVEKDFTAICNMTVEYLGNSLCDAHTFKVNAKRSDKHFCMNSPEICTELGGFLLDKFPNLTVDVHNPECIVTIEIRETAAYVHANQLPGAGGIPVGSGGKAMLLISGGIDSPVAGTMLAKRGLEIEAIHFASPPYTSEHAKQKVITLTEKMCEYCGRINLYIVPFTKIQEEIKDNCPEDLFTIIMRRVMMRLAIIVAEKSGSTALITGESVGQTIQAIACTDAICTIPVLRPVIGMDKEEIIQIARKIDTFETSILPYEDCCTVFTPKRPRTRPRLEEVVKAELSLHIDEMIET